MPCPSAEADRDHCLGQTPGGRGQRRLLGIPVDRTAWQQVVEAKGASLEDEVAWCREALRLGSLKVIRDQIGQWERRPEVQKDPGVLAIAAEMQSITGHAEESLRLAREAVAAATGKSADLSTCRLSLARVLLMVRDTDSDATQDRGEAVSLLRDLALSNAPERRDALEILRGSRNSPRWRLC